MKIGIISELNMKNANYGNRLQAFALNKYMNTRFSENITESLYFNFYDKKRITKFLPKKYIEKVLNKIKKKRTLFKSINIDERIRRANDFTLNNTVLCSECMSWAMLKESDYDCFIVGSDVVWAQSCGEINRIRFLDFKNKKNFFRVSYAASFGKNWIPKENKKKLKKMLDKFEYISLREGNSINLLNELGIESAVHVCDPTLLLSKNEWKNVEEKININEKYIFVYLLGKSREQRDNIKKIALEKNLKIVNIPNANEQYSVVDDTFGDIKLNDCSPGQWIYLIKNSEYFFTDSFHGTIFATIFNKKFIVLKRETESNINNRMENFLELIDEKDKFIENSSQLKIDAMKWNYKKINSKVEDFSNKSKEYLDNIFKYNKRR